MEMARVVVLDDDASVADLLKAVVEESGHTTIAARDLAQVPADTQADLVVSDLLPLKAYRRDAALAWVQQLRDRFAAPVILVTGHGGALAEPDRLGADEVVGKPFDVDALIEIVTGHLERRPAPHILKTP